MKIVIDIPERDYDLACKYPNALIATYAHYIKEGTPYEERPTGHWIDDYAGEVDAEFGRHRYRCSCCGKRANYFIGGLDDWWDMEAPDFCSNCGADMRGDKNGN